jgi:predicted nucleic acid-binding protein
MPVVVSDASPLICLSAIGQFDLLRKLYGEVVVPTAVWREITRVPPFSTAPPQQPAAAQAAGWLRVATPTN